MSSFVKRIQQLNKWRINVRASTSSISDIHIWFFFFGRTYDADVFITHFFKQLYIIGKENLYKRLSLNTMLPITRY